MTAPRIDLLWLGSTECPVWGLGATESCRAEPSAVAAAVEGLVEKGRSEAILTWDSELELPDPEKISRAVERPGDLWHAGLALGMGGLPGLLDYVSPTWMLSADPSIEREATSWRVSLRACMIRSEVVRQLGGPEGEFDSIAGCALELGHRYALSGALPRHLPWLLEDRQKIDPQVLPIEDEVRFLARRVGKFWSRWALTRALVDRRIIPGDFLRLLSLTSLSKSRGQQRRHLTRNSGSDVVETGSVTILVPTLDRYEYLETLLGQIAKQTVQPSQVIVVDQTAPERRRSDPRIEHLDLPLEVMFREEPGQCSSRNAGLQAATGDYILFLDDDVEISEDLIERHLMTLAAFGADVSSGVAEEVGAGPLPAEFEVLRVSDVFPTNNTLVRRWALDRSGLFDLAYEHGARADGDLGMRVYLSGALMVLNPEIRVLHHHAPVGGLRSHRARAVTYASSRNRLLHRHLPAVTEIYLARRYFSYRQVRESLLLRVLGTLSVRGGYWKRLTKFCLGSVLLPHTLSVVFWRYRMALGLLEDYPQIPDLQEPAAGGSAK